MKSRVWFQRMLNFLHYVNLQNSGFWNMWLKTAILISDQNFQSRENLSTQRLTLYSSDFDFRDFLDELFYIKRKKFKAVCFILAFLFYSLKIKFDVDFYMLGSCRAWAHSSRGRKSSSHRRWGSRTSKEKRRGGSQKECSRRYVYEFLRIPSGAWKTTKGQGKTMVYNHFFFQKIPCERALFRTVVKSTHKILPINV